MRNIIALLLLSVCCATDIKAGNGHQPTDKASAFASKGDSCMARFDVFHATQYYNLALSTDTANVGILRKLASCYRRSGNWKYCLSCLDLMPQDSIGHEDMRMYYYRSTLATRIKLRTGVSA